MNELDKVNRNDVFGSIDPWESIGNFAEFWDLATGWAGRTMDEEAWINEVE